MYREVDSLTFDEEIKKDCIVDFYTSICPSCEKFAPVFEEKAKSVSSHKFLKVNLDDDTTLAERYGISHVPTIIKFSNGEPIKTAIGYMDEKQLDEFIMQQ